MKRSLYLVVLVLVHQGCIFEEKTSEVHAVNNLVNRCIRLRLPMSVIESPKGGLPYLSRGTSDADRPMLQLPAGSETIVRSVRLRSTFEMTTVQVLVESRESKQMFDGTLLFSGAWILAASQALKRDDVSANVLREPELNPPSAEWCEQNGPNPASEVAFLHARRHSEARHKIGR